jgi:hypothetical protein
MLLHRSIVLLSKQRLPTAAPIRWFPLLRGKLSPPKPKPATSPSNAAIGLKKQNLSCKFVTPN